MYDLKIYFASSNDHKKQEMMRLLKITYSQNWKRLDQNQILQLKIFKIIYLKKLNISKIMSQE